MKDYQGNLIPDKLEGWEMGPAPLDPARILEIRNSRIEKILGAKAPSKTVCEIIAYRTKGDRLLDSPVMTREELEALPESALLALVDMANAKIRANSIALGDMTLQEFKDLETQLKSFEEKKSASIHEALIRDEKVIAEFRASSNLDALELLYKELDKRYDDLSYQASKYRRGRHQIPSWLSSQLKEAKEKTLALKEKIAKIKKDLSDLRDSLYDKREEEAPKMPKELMKFKELVEFLDINFNL